MSNQTKSVASIEGGTQVTPITNPLELLQSAIDKGVDPGALEKLMDLAERHDKAVAAKDFDAAMSGFQAECPPIRRIKDAGRWTYAPLEKVMDTIQPYMKKYGLSVRFSTKWHDTGYITCYCTVAHVSGHKETSELTVPVDDKQAVNSSQKQGSANSYAKRYALSNALNLSYCDEDDDGYSSGTATLDAERAANIEALIDEVGADKEKFLKWCGVDSIENIPASNYSDCVRSLERKREK